MLDDYYFELRLLFRSNPYALLVLLSSLSLSGCENNDSSTDAKRPPAVLSSIQDAIAAADLTEDAYYDKTYRQVEAMYWLRIAGWLSEHALQRQFIDQKPVQTILDLGCGYGTLLALAVRTYGADGVCFDVIPFIQLDVQKRYGIDYQQVNIEQDDFPIELAVDVVLMTEVVEHLNFHPKYTLQKIFKALKPGGSFFLSTPDADKGWGRVFKYYESIEAMPAPDPNAEWIDGHIWQYTEAEIRAVLLAAGFEIKRLENTPGPVGEHFNIWAIKPSN